MTISASDPLFMGVYIVARICLAAVFVYSGFDKARNWAGVVEECEAFKLPMPKLIAAGTIGLHIVGGLCVVFGIFTAPFALALAAFTAVATCLAHNFWVHKGERFGKELTTALEHLGIVGALVLIAALDMAL